VEDARKHPAEPPSIGLEMSLASARRTAILTATGLIAQTAMKS